jgi:hypothetical protein
MSGRLHVHAALLIGLLACEAKPKPRTQEQIAALRAKHDALKQRAADADLRLGKQIEQEMQRLGPDPALGPCPVGRAALELTEDPIRKSPLYRTSRIKQGEPLERFFGPTSKSFSDEFHGFTRELEDEVADEDELEKRLDAYTIEPPSGYWFVLAVETFVKPQIIADGQFVPGVFVGELFVWDASTEQLICGAPIGATSREKVEVIRHAVDGEVEKDPEFDAVQLKLDLEENAVNIALSQLSKLGPRAAEPAIDNAGEEPPP